MCIISFSQQLSANRSGLLLWAKNSAPQNVSSVFYALSVVYARHRMYPFLKTD